MLPVTGSGVVALPSEVVCPTPTGTPSTTSGVKFGLGRPVSEGAGGVMTTSYPLLLAGSGDSVKLAAPELPEAAAATVVLRICPWLSSAITTAPASAGGR